MFDDVAGRYDLTNDVLSLGQDRLWRRAGRARPSPRGRARPCSTSPPAPAPAASRSPTPGVDVVPADFSLGMLRVGNRRRPDLAFTAADAMRLPFADDSFDAVTMSFGLRNVADPGAGPARVPAGDPARRPAGGVRVQPAGQRGLPEGLHRVPHALAAADRPPGQLQPRVLRLPGRVDPGLARPARARRGGRGRRLERRRSGATCPAASSPCTAPSRPADRRAHRECRPGARAGPRTSPATRRRESVRDVTGSASPRTRLSTCGPGVESPQQVREPLHKRVQRSTTS